LGAPRGRASDALAGRLRRASREALTPRRRLRKGSLFTEFTIIRLPTICYIARAFRRQDDSREDTGRLLDERGVWLQVASDGFVVGDTTPGGPAVYRPDDGRNHLGAVGGRPRRVTRSVTARMRTRIHRNDDLVGRYSRIHVALFELLARPSHSLCPQL